MASEYTPSKGELLQLLENVKSQREDSPKTKLSEARYRKAEKALDDYFHSATARRLRDEMEKAYIAYREQREKDRVELEKIVNNARTQITLLGHTPEVTKMVQALLKRVGR